MLILAAFLQRDAHKSPIINNLDARDLKTNHSVIMSRMILLEKSSVDRRRLDLPTLHYAGRCSDVDFGDKEYPQVEPRSI